MDFGANKAPVEIIKEGAFGGTYFTDIYSKINGKSYRKTWKVCDVLKDTDQKYYYSNYYDASVNKYDVKCETSLKFWKNEGYIHSINPYGWLMWYFRYWLGIRYLDDKRQIDRSKNIATKFKDKLVKMIKYADNKCYDYSISPKIR